MFLFADADVARMSLSKLNMFNTVFQCSVYFKTGCVTAFFLHIFCRHKCKINVHKYKTAVLLCGIIIKMCSINSSMSLSHACKTKTEFSNIHATTHVTTSLRKRGGCG